MGQEVSHSEFTREQRLAFREKVLADLRVMDAAYPTGRYRPSEALVAMVDGSERAAGDRETGGPAAAGRETGERETGERETGDHHTDEEKERA